MSIRFLLFLLVFAAAIGFFAYNCARLLKFLSIGKPERRLDNVGARVKNVLVVAFGQKKLLREPLAGLMHFFIYWGFVILLTAVIEAIIQGMVPGFSLASLGPLFPPLAFLQETIGLLVFLSVLVALARWLWIPPKRYFGPEIGGHVRLDASMILCLILVIMVSMFGTNATQMLLTGQMHRARFVSTQLAVLFPEASSPNVWFDIFWWTHILAVLGFLNYLPYSKHLHVITSIPNVFFSSLEPRGAL